jgi:DNA-directed RNA polymerase subunit RPC12/RpoP
MELVPYYVLTIDEDSIASLKALFKNDPEVEHRPSIPQVADSEIAAKQVQDWKRESIGPGELQFNFPHNPVQNQCITVNTFENRPIIQPDPSAVNDLPPQIDLSERRYHNEDYMYLGHYRQKPYDRQDDLFATDPSIAALRRTPAIIWIRRAIQVDLFLLKPIRLQIFTSQYKFLRFQEALLISWPEINNAVCKRKLIFITYFEIFKGYYLFRDRVTSRKEKYSLLKHLYQNMSLSEAFASFYELVPENVVDAIIRTMCETIPLDPNDQMSTQPSQSAALSTLPQQKLFMTPGSFVRTDSGCRRCTLRVLVKMRKPKQTTAGDAHDADEIDDQYLVKIVKVKNLRGGVNLSQKQIRQNVKIFCKHLC